MIMDTMFTKTFLKTYGTVGVMGMSHCSKHRDYSCICSNEWVWLGYNEIQPEDIESECFKENLGWVV